MCKYRGAALLTATVLQSVLGISYCLGFLTVSVSLLQLVSVSLLQLQVSGYHRALHCRGMKSQPERRAGNAYE